MDSDDLKALMVQLQEADSTIKTLCATLDNVTQTAFALSLFLQNVEDQLSVCHQSAIRLARATPA
jgi:DNA repair exonuclease SbcCD ATPase subunit